MIITREMLHAATQKAVELGVLPRHSYADDFATNAEIMQEILQAALDANSHAVDIADATVTDIKAA